LWDVVKMSIVQSFNMSAASPLCVAEHMTRSSRANLSIRLGSCLSMNGLHISTTMRGGYDIYSLDSGMLLHTFAHDLPQAILDGHYYPSTFLPNSFTFCGATVDATVTLWDVKVGDLLQSVRHDPCESFVSFHLQYFSSS
jgi:WD40 repeat protein